MIRALTEDAMEEGLAFKTRAAWRRWLSAHHGASKVQWLIFFKKQSGKKGLTYEEAVEEAICFGWIDGLVKRRDEETFMQKFTPRRQGGTWSESNLKRARKMVSAGKMSPAGLEALGDALEKYDTEGVAHQPPRTDVVPEDLMALLKASPRALEGFEKLAPSCRREYLGWVMDAKREETRIRRMKEVASVLSAGKKLGMK
jgi:uncharacterized protein YdeI (YjbR/CyaY-like superfamily)